MRKGGCDDGGRRQEKGKPKKLVFFSTNFFFWETPVGCRLRVPTSHTKAPVLSNGLNIQNKITNADDCMGYDKRCSGYPSQSTSDTVDGVNGNTKKKHDEAYTT